MKKHLQTAAEMSNRGRQASSPQEMLRSFIADAPSQSETRKKFIDKVEADKTRSRRFRRNSKTNHETVGSSKTYTRQQNQMITSRSPTGQQLYALKTTAGNKRQSSMSMVQSTGHAAAVVGAFQNGLISSA